MWPRKKFLLTIHLFFTAFVFAQGKGEIDSSAIASPLQHYLSEYAFDVTSDEKAWQNELPGLHAAFGSADELYFRTEVPRLKTEDLTWQATGWKGERLNVPIIVWSKDSIEQIRFQIHDLKTNNGKVLKTENIELNKVCYVLSNYPYNAANTDCGGGPTNKAYLMPDRFEKFDRFDLRANTVRPVWVSLNIPRDAAAGTYTGTVKVNSSKGMVVLNVKISVQEESLPKPHDWKFRLDLWQNPWVIADYFHVKPWSDEHKVLLKKHLKLYAEAGGTYITTYGVHSPWGGNEYYIEGGMIEWIKRRDGSWKFDYSIFDQYVEIAMSVGIDKAITIYTPLPWGERFRYMDEPTGNFIYERWLPTSDTFITNWNVFLTDLKKHLEQKGWFNKTYLGVNENEMRQTLSAISVIRNHSKLWKITYAGDWHKELDTLLDDYSSVSPKEPAVDEVKNRLSHHQYFYILYMLYTP